MTALDQLAYNRRQAADASGFSKDIIDAAVRSGDLRETFPEVNGKRLKRGVILREHLEEWLTGERKP
ncbi:MAG: hypothetical protein GEU78_09605 [Actinobacteria bacterium]|nr:hypothetical protein [Actinomycetota bacterium]